MFDWSGLFGRVRRKPARSPGGPGLRVEALEDRSVPSTLYVNGSADGADTGTNWADAFTSLQSALAASHPGDQIWVARGTYKPTITADRKVSFALRDGVSVYGGF